MCPLLRVREPLTCWSVSDTCGFSTWSEVSGSWWLPFPKPAMGWPVTYEVRYHRQLGASWMMGTNWTNRSFFQSFWTWARPQKSPLTGSRSSGNSDAEEVIHNFLYGKKGIVEVWGVPRATGSLRKPPWSGMVPQPWTFEITSTPLFFLVELFLQENCSLILALPCLSDHVRVLTHLIMVVQFS